MLTHKHTHTKRRTYMDAYTFISLLLSALSVAFKNISTTKEMQLLSIVYVNEYETKIWQTAENMQFRCICTQWTINMVASGCNIINCYTVQTSKSVNAVINSSSKIS